jgi:hydrogenase maturation protease
VTAQANGSSLANRSSLVNLSSLVVGYGNPLRGDDGIGWVIAERLADDPRMAGVEVVARHQLTPELALDVSRVDLVVLVDARSGPPAGSLAIEQVDPSSSSGTTWSHHVSPASLVALARELYGRAAEVRVVSVGAGSLDVGEGLSPLVQAAVDRAVDAIAELVLRAADAGRQPVAEIGHA